MNNAIYGNTMKNLRNRIDLKLVKNIKDYLKWTSKPSYMSQKIFDNYFVTIPKNKVILILQKPAYVGMCVLGLSKVFMYEFHYDYILWLYFIYDHINMITTLGYYSLILTVGCMTLKLKMFMKNLVKIEQFLISAIIQLS